MLKKTLLLLCSTLTILAGTIIAPALPTIEKTFTIDQDISLLVGLILTITSLVIAITAPMAGWLADKIGRKPLLLSSLLLYGLSGSSGFFLQSLEQIFISRIFLGLSVAGVMTSATTLIGDYYTGEEREKFLGYQASFIAIGGFIFLISGGFLASIWWRGPFLIYLLSWLLIIPVYYFLNEPSKSHISLPATPQEKTAWLKYFLILITGLFGMMIYFLIPTKLPFYLFDELHLSPGKTGLYMAVSILFSAIMSSRYQFIHRYLSKPIIFALSFCIMGAGLKLLSSFEKITIILPGVAIIGLGFGLILPNCTVWTTKIAPESMRGRMLGGLTASLFFGQFLSTIIGESIQQTFDDVGPLKIFGLGSLLSLILAFIYVSYWIYRRARS